MDPGKETDEGLSTEEKIKEAARKLFTRKGYAGTRTRDIAEAAGINLALLNYYFRSKEKLFEQIMMEKVHLLFGHITPVVQDPATSLDEKIERISSLYIDILSDHPDLPLFVLSEIRNHPQHFTSVFNIDQLFRDSSFIKQLGERRPDISPFQFLMSIMGMTLFPFIAKPVFQAAGEINESQFAIIMAQRKSLIPLWTKAILKAGMHPPKPHSNR